MSAPAKLIVLMAFDRDDSGELVLAFEPREMPSEERARSAARGLVSHHAGVIAWSRPADPSVGEYGDPVELFRAGDVPDID